MATIDIAHRAPRNSSAVLPVFRQDATPIPDYFLDKVMPKLSATYVKIALVIFREMHKRGDEEIITFPTQLQLLAGQSSYTVKACLKFFMDEEIFQVSYLEQIRTPDHRASMQPIKIKFLNRINYSRLD